MSVSSDDNQSPGSGPLYADVIVPRHVAGPFTYVVPPLIRSKLRVGHWVEVPFGRAVLLGAVTALSHRPPGTVDSGRLREIHGFADDSQSPHVSQRLFHLAKRVSEEYVAPWGQCLRLVLPPAIVHSAAGSRLIATAAGQAVLEVEQDLPEEARAILKRLVRRAGGVKKKTILTGLKTKTRSGLISLIERGWVAEVAEPETVVQESESSYQEEQQVSDPCLPSLPAEWESRLVSLLSAGKAERLVLQAPLPYRLALLCCGIRKVVGRGQSVLIIVGEAERAGWMVSVISRETGLPVVGFHSGLPKEEQTRIWNRADGVPVVVGTRSSVFLPSNNLGMVWVERGEDPALKEPQEPRYHARDVAWIRAQNQLALHVDASAHPLVETFTAAEAGGFLLRQEPAPLLGSLVDVVDLRLQDRRSLLSPVLREAVAQSISQRTGALLFLNRKGFAGALICRDCGQVPRCPSCHVALTYYRQPGRLSCAYCGSSIAVPAACPACAGLVLQLVGEGTERVEEEVKQVWPQARVVRVDSDTMPSPAKASAVWARIERRDWDILIGTQLLLRDYVVPPVGVVGIVHADAGLNLPDFRAAERTFHQLHDAAALARFGTPPGQVVIQTYLPSHHVIQSLLQGRDDVFRFEELSHRKALGYPPFVHVIVLHVSGVDPRIVARAAKDWTERLSAVSNASAVDPSGVSRQLVLMGPVPAPVPKLRGKTRLQILVKSAQREAGIDAVRTTVAWLERSYPARSAKFDIDVDPVEMW